MSAPTLDAALVDAAVQNIAAAARRVTIPKAERHNLATRLREIAAELDPPPATAKQSAPTGSGLCVWDLVIQDMQARDAEGTRRYGTALRTHNGRDALVDAYQEALDLVVYLRQALVEREP